MNQLYNVLQQQLKHHSSQSFIDFMHMSNKQTNIHSNNGVYQEPNSGTKLSNYHKFLHRRIQTEADQATGSSSTNQGNPLKYNPQNTATHHYYGNTFYKNKFGEAQKLSGTHTGFQNASTSHLNTHNINYNNTNKINNNSHMNSLSTNVDTFNNMLLQKKQLQSSASHPNLGKKYYKKLTKPALLRYYLNTEGNNEEEDKTTIRKHKTNTNNKEMNYHNKYQIEGIAGKGTFGVVYYGRANLTGEKIALKKVLQDRKYKNRQLDIMKQIKHPNLLEMKDFFFTSDGSQQYLNVVMDFYSDNLYQVIKKKQLTPLLIKIYSYQILRGLNYLTRLSIAHRDIKPQNILIDRNTHKVVICDFGSAKKLVKGQLNIAYICSRCYRAPQLIFGATQYTSQIDMWSFGCVVVQMVNGEAPFLGDSQIDQLLEIIKILGTPQKRDIQEMNSKYDLNEFKKLPKIKSVSWKKIVNTEDPLLIDLISNILEYSPQKRFTALDALKHSYFDELNQLSYDKNKDYLKKMKIKNIPQFFDYNDDEIECFGIKKDQEKEKWQKDKIKSSMIQRKLKQDIAKSQIEQNIQKSIIHVNSQGKRMFVTQYNQDGAVSKQSIKKRPQKNLKTESIVFRAAKLVQKKTPIAYFTQTGNDKTNQQSEMNSTQNASNYTRNVNLKKLQYH